MGFGIKINLPKWDPIKDISNIVSNVGKNIEGNVQVMANDLGQIASGNFNNVGNSLLNSGFMGSGALFANPKDASKVVGTTGSQRAVQDAQAKYDNQIQADVQAQADERLRQISTAISGAITARQRAPGRAQTLLYGPRTGNTLLTLVGN